MSTQKIAGLCVFIWGLLWILWVLYKDKNGESRDQEPTPEQYQQRRNKLVLIYLGIVIAIFLLIAAATVLPYEQS
jgi:hypothetical protein